MLVGFVGKSNTGKSTMFKALTLADVEIANRIFVTIKPNHATGYIKVKCVDKEFNVQCNPRVGYCSHGYRFVPVDLLDVAGLVPGAHKGYGLGNKFLDDLRQGDCLIHVVDISGSTNEKGEPVERGSYDPANDIKFLEHELDMWYFQIFQKIWKKFSNQVNQEKSDVVKAIAKQFSGLKVDEDLVKATLKKLQLNKPIIKWTENDLKKLTLELRKETKKIIIAANKIDVPGAEANYKRIKEQFPDYIVIPCSAESELALKEASKHELIEYVPGEKNFKILQEDKLNDKQKNALDFIKNLLNKYGSTGVQEVINKAVFDLLQYIAVFPVPNSKLIDSDNKVLPDCFLIPEKTKALDFAYRVHTTIGDTFVRAINVKTNLALKKDQFLKHRDVIEIIHTK